MPFLDVEAATEALTSDPSIRARLVRDYGLQPASSQPDDLVGALLEAFGQAPLANPLRRPPSPTEVLQAAARAIGSNSRRWSTFVALEPALAELLHNYDPVAAVADIDAGRLSVDLLRPCFPGITGRADATAILRWSRRAYGGLFAHQIQATVDAVRGAHVGAVGSALPSEYLMPLIVAYLAAPSARLQVSTWMSDDFVFDAVAWKLPGMGPVLGSEFFRNLGWDGFKPDRHVMRLLDRWCPTVVEDQRATSRGLARLIGRRDRVTIDFLTYSLAGQNITPRGVPFSIADNLVWALGAYVERAGKETDRQYLTG